MDVINFLNTISAEDEFGFLKQVESNWESHRPLLYLALSLTNGVFSDLLHTDVVELGSGEGSTPYLRKYCKALNRDFKSFESNYEWAQKMGSQHIIKWDDSTEWQQPCSVLFVDEAPGEHRIVAIETMKDRADIIVVHDTELYSAADYGFHKKKAQGSIWDEFRYVLHYNRNGSHAGATAVSQKINLNQFKFHSLNNYKFE